LNAIIIKPSADQRVYFSLKIRNIVILLLFFCFPGINLSGQPEQDSLRRIVFSDGEGPERRADAASDLGNLYLLKDLDTAAYYSSLGLEISIQNTYYPGVFKNSCVLGKVALRKDSIDKAKGIFEYARTYFDRLDDKRDALCILLLSGYAYGIHEDYFKSREALYTGLTLAEQLPDSAFLWSFCNNLGAHYVEMKEYQKGAEFLRRGIQIHRELREDQRRYSLGSTYNNLALAFIGLDLPDSARSYLDKALNLQDVRGNYYGLQSLYGNMGQVYSMKDFLDTALLYYGKAKAALDSLKPGFKGSMAPLYANHYRYLGRIHQRKGEMERARYYFDLALNYADLASDLEVKEDVFLGLSEISESLGDYETSLNYKNKFLSVRDTLYERRSDQKVARLTLEYEFEQEMNAKKRELELQELNHRRRELIYLFFIVTSGGLLVSLFLLFLLQRNRARRKNLEQKTIRLENEKISEELEYKKKELTTNVLYLLRKNEFIGSISQKLNRVLGRLSDEDAMILKGIINELDKTSLDDTWLEFETRFMEVHTDFYNRLSKKFPALTAQELRLCAFLRLNMTNKEIASITYQSPDSLKTARYRLRKKLGLDRDENLVAFLTRI
jgi:tetratricopeptide (TPR) repeat protein